MINLKASALVGAAVLVAVSATGAADATVQGSYSTSFNYTSDGATPLRSPSFTMPNIDTRPGSWFHGGISFSGTLKAVESYAGDQNTGTEFVYYRDMNMGASLVADDGVSRGTVIAWPLIETRYFIKTGAFTDYTEYSLDGSIPFDEQYLPITPGKSYHVEFSYNYTAFPWYWNEPATHPVNPVFTFTPTQTSGNVDVYYSYDSVVPEPATWAMMIAGFGVAGGAVRRRRARSASNSMGFAAL